MKTTSSTSSRTISIAYWAPLLSFVKGQQLGKTRPGQRHNASGRSTGEGKHVRLHEWMLASPAYRSLSCHARCLLTELKRLYNGDNNGRLHLSVRKAAELLGASKDTSQKAFRELQCRGFIRARQVGTFGWKQGKATTWILEEFPVDDQLPTKSFMRWRPDHKSEPGPAYQDSVSCLEGQSESEATQIKANCPAHQDTLKQIAPESVLPDRTHIIYQGGMGRKHCSSAGQNSNSAAAQPQKTRSTA